MKITMETIKNVGKVAGVVALYGAAVIVPRLSKKDIGDIVMRFNGNVEYIDVVNAIMDSPMLSSDKQYAISVVKRDETCDYYKSVIRVVKSTMLSSDKIKTIEILNGGEEL